MDQFIIHFDIHGIIIGYLSEHIINHNDMCPICDKCFDKCKDELLYI